MTLQVLIVNGGKESGQIRGQQIGQALGALVTSRPRPSDWAWADVVILVKRAMYQWSEEALHSKARVIWDVLDIWDQPAQNNASFEALVAGIKLWQAEVPCVLIGATQAMADDIGGVYIPHHIRPGLQPRPVREQMEIVAYEGLEKYLGSWRGHLESVCKSLGLQFVVNPPDLSEADLIVAFRGEEWDGQVCRRWKSGVKIINAIGCGRRILTQPCAASFELAADNNTIASPALLLSTVKRVSDPILRKNEADFCSTIAPQFTLDAIARKYTDVIQQALSA